MAGSEKTAALFFYFGKKRAASLSVVAFSSVQMKKMAV